MFDDTLLVTELFFVTDPSDKPEWLLLPKDPEPLLPEVRRALKFVVEISADQVDPNFVAHLKGFLVRPKNAA